jgi:hypothetical protein
MTDNVVELENLKKEIEKLSKIHHITILKIIKSEPSIVINENKNGVFLNLSEIPLEIIDKLKSYCEYLKSQDKQLNIVENEKTELEVSYF